MPKIYYAKEIYKKIPVNLQHPTALDTPIVPIRGLYVAGLHRNIFNIDHCVQITALENQPARWVNYTRITADMSDDGGFIMRGIKRRIAAPSKVPRPRINRDHIGDSHCVKILDISNSPVDITSYSE